MRIHATQMLLFPVMSGLSHSSRSVDRKLSCFELISFFIDQMRYSENWEQCENTNQPTQSTLNMKHSAMVGRKRMTGLKSLLCSRRAPDLPCSHAVPPPTALPALPQPPPPTAQHKLTPCSQGFLRTPLPTLQTIGHPSGRPSYLSRTLSTCCIDIIVMYV